MHDGGDGVEEGQLVLAGLRPDGVGQGAGRERSGGDDGRTVLGAGQGVGLAAFDAHQGVVFQGLLDGA